MTKTKFTINRDGSVTVEYSCHMTEVRVSRTFLCPPNGGYVREKGGGRQVCTALDFTGPALVSPSRAELPALIRREYRRMRAADKKLLDL